MLAIGIFLLVSAVVSFTAGFLAMTVEIACDAENSTKSSQSFYMQVAVCAGFAAMLGFCFANLLGGPMFGWAVAWTFLPAAFRLVVHYVRKRAFVDRFVGAGHGFAKFFVKRSDAQSGRNDFGSDAKSVQVAARVAIEAIERDLRCKRSDDGGSAHVG